MLETDLSVRSPYEGMPDHPGTCNICGKPTTFYYPDPKLYRETLYCAHCRSTSRYRSIARGLLRAIRELTGIEASSLASLPSHSSASLWIYDTQVAFHYHEAAYPIPDHLARCTWINLHLSRWTETQPLGTPLGPRTTNQNLEALTWPDAHFDILITSDVLEHVRLDHHAHREIRRVLKPGGIYLFTVPHHRAPQTIQRIAIIDPADPSQDLVLVEPEYHGDPNVPEGRALSYRVYGTDLDEQLRALGFEVEYLAEGWAEGGVVNTELFYCRVT